MNNVWRERCNLMTTFVINYNERLHLLRLMSECFFVLGINFPCILLILSCDDDSDCQDLFFFLSKFVCFFTPCSIEFLYFSFKWKQFSDIWFRIKTKKPFFFKYFEKSLIFLINFRIYPSLYFFFFNSKYFWLKN